MDDEYEPAYTSYVFTDDGKLKLGSDVSPCQTAEPSAKLPLHEAINRAHMLAKAGALEIWINPRNESNDMGPAPLNTKIFKILTKYCSNFILIAEVPPHNLTYWHYHGLCNIIGNDIMKIQKLKRCLSRNVGRSSVNQITNTPAYVDYMFKMYTTAHVLHKIQPFTNNSYITPFTNESVTARKCAK